MRPSRRSKKLRLTLLRSTKRSRRFRRSLDAVTEPFQNQRGKLTIINYNAEIASPGKAKDGYRAEAKEWRAKVVDVDLPAADGSGKTATQKLNYDQPRKAVQ